MYLAFITLAVALSISAVAIYYSVAGLVAIFASAAIPIMIMGGSLEIGKLVTAVWLHKYWGRATWWLRTYLALAVVILMLITSMGIFGFLSKAHIEQTSASTESVAQVERLTTEIARQNDVIKRAELKTNSLQTSGTGADANVQAQIDKEQQRIDTAYARIQPAIDEQNKTIGSQAKLYQDELDRIDTAMQTVVGYIDSGDKENYKKAQAIIGIKPDGAFGAGSTRAYTAWKDAKNTERKVLLTNIQQATNNLQARAATREIKRIRTAVEIQIAESNKLINRLRANIGKVDKTADIDAQVDEQNARIKTANDSIDKLTEEKYTLEIEYRKLEAEVGPIKYIAEFVYGEEADKNMLEKAVTWVIIIIIFVFDPLAVLLLIASQYTFEWHRKDRKDKNEEMASDDWEFYEKARAELVAQNVPSTFTEQEPECPDCNAKVLYECVACSSNNYPQPDGLTSEEIVEPNYDADDGPLTDKQLDEIQQDAQMLRQEDENGTNELIEDTVGNDSAVAGPEGRDASAGMVMAGEEENDIEVQLDESNKAVSNIPNTKNRMFYPEELEPKKSIKSPEELEREQEYDLKEQDEKFLQNKTVWKDAHPDQTLKHYKNLYVKGVIDSLPWESPAQVDNYNTNQGYQQNAEQSERTLFNKLSKK